MNCEYVSGINGKDKIFFASYDNATLELLIQLFW